MGQILLTEGFVFGAAELIPESQLTESDRKVVSKYGGGGGSSKNPILQGVCQMADTKNGNDRIYPRAILEREVNKYMHSIKERRALAELDHPEDSVINLKNVSHMITEMWWEGNKVMCKCVIFDNPKIPSGQLAAGLVQEGVLLGISSRGLGSVAENYSEGGTVVEDDFNLICFDLVSEPSTPGAWQYPTSGASSRPRINPTKKLNQMEEQELMRYLAKENKGYDNILDEILRG